MTTTSPEARAAYAAALRSVRDGTGKGNIGLHRAIELDPDFAAAHLRLVNSIGCFGDQRVHYVKALEGRERLNARDRAMVQAYEPTCQHEPPDVDETDRRLAAIAEQYPRDPIALWAHRPEDPNANLRATARLIAVDPGFANAYAWRAATQGSYLGDVPGAIASFEKCLELSPGAANCQGQLVQLLQRGDDCPRLEREARRAILMGVEYQSPWFALADALAAQGQPVDAVREVLRQAESKKVSPGDDLPFMVAAADVVGGDFEAARRGAEQMDRAADARPGELAHEVAAALLVEVANESGDVAAARAAAARFLTRRAGWEPAPFSDSTALFIAALKRGGHLPADEAARARDVARGHLAQVESIEPWAVWGSLWAEGVSSADDAREALAHLPDAAPHGLTRGADQAEFGHVFLLAGRVDAALPWLERAARACDVVSSPFAATRAHLWLAEAREKKGDRAGACDEYDRLLRRWGAARPRSVSADEARARRRALGCDGPR